MVATRFLVANHHERLLHGAFDLVVVGGCGAPSRLHQCPSKRFAAASVLFPDDLRTLTTVSRSNPRPISSVISSSLGAGISIRCRSCKTNKRVVNIRLWPVLENTTGVAYSCRPPSVGKIYL